MANLRGDDQRRRWLWIVGGDGAAGRVVEDIRWAVSAVGVFTDKTRIHL
jgi:hypothetical protein